MNLLLEIKKPKAIASPFHDRLIKLLKYYFVIGGMPEAVATFKDQNNLNSVRIVQKEILNAYMLDFSKHAPSNDVMKIMAIWEQIPNQLAKENKKFIFSAMSKNARAREYESSIQWLNDAGLILKTHNIETVKLPLSAYANKRAFKIFLLDVGLLSTISQLPTEVILEGSRLFEEFKGALSENFVAQELVANNFDEIYYWTSKGTAEVDFLISTHQKNFPLEVKAGISKKKKSLLEFGKKHLGKDGHTPVLSRATLRNFEHNNNVINYPLYAVRLFPFIESIHE